MSPLGDLRYNRLLVAVDGSASAELALSAAVSSAERNHATIALVGVSPDLSRWPQGSAYDPTVQGQADEEAQQLLRDTSERIPDDIPVTTIFRRGSAGHEIVAVAGESDYDAIFVGARGVGRVRAMFGSVSSHVLHHADVAVFVAHAPKADQPDEDAAGAEAGAAA